jgi:purine nucleosidase
VGQIKHARRELETRKIIIDTDPGRDDAVAILLALASPELEVVGIVAVAGNVPLHHTERNARRLVDLAGRSDVPVYAGCERPMARELVTSEHIHGQNGLAGYELPEPTKQLESQHGVDFIIETVMSSESGTITLCHIGPLTNIGTALVKEPRIAGRIREIVLMGGTRAEAGNITPSAEYNIYVDPEAADILLNSGIAITIARDRSATVGSLRGRVSYPARIVHGQDGQRMRRDGEPVESRNDGSRLVACDRSTAQRELPLRR